MKLPESMSAGTVHVLKIVQKANKSVDFDYIKSKTAPEEITGLGAMVSGAVRREMLRNKPEDGKAMYQLTTLGVHALANLNKIVIKEPQRGQYQKVDPDKPRQTRRSKNAIPLGVLPTALPNVSTNATALMDNIGGVIAENVAYRDALTRIGNDIARLLGMVMRAPE